jgi:hypothetical protein
MVDNRSLRPGPLGVLGLPRDCRRLVLGTAANLPVSRFHFTCRTVPPARLGYDRSQRMPAAAPIRISKSKFVAGVQCLKRLYFQVHEPELAEETDEGQEARLEQGQEVGLLAQGRFPDGVLVGFENGIDDALANTAALMDDSSVPAIFEATFQHSNLLVRVDILQRRPQNRWRLIEVKSAVEVKPHFLYDVAIQDHVLNACGLDISSTCLMHLNRDYRYSGMQHDLRTLFTIRDQTRQIRRLDTDIARLLKAQRKALAQPSPPDISPGPQCLDPRPCEFFSHCNPEPPEHHISFLPRLSAKKKDALIRLGVALIHKIPDDFALTAHASPPALPALPGIPKTSNATLSR